MIALGTSTGSALLEPRFAATLADVPKESVSQDPLGFGASAERLAESFVPGLTVFTRAVRYYQLVVAAARIASQAGRGDARSVVMRLERVWALATYLSDQDRGNRTGSGLLGITYVRAAAKPQNASQRLDYPFFNGATQAQVGAWGLYRRSATNLHFLRSGVPSATGARLSDPFLEAVDDLALRRAALSQVKTASTALLREFGERVGLFTPIDIETARAMWDALGRGHPGRGRAAKAIRTQPGNQAALLTRLKGLRAFEVQATAAEALEDAFIAVSRTFDAAVDLATQTDWVDPDVIRNSQALIDELDDWKQRADQTAEQLERGGVDHAIVDLGRSLAGAVDPWDALQVLVARHHHVQAVKGRQPWLNWSGGYLVAAAATPDAGYDPYDLESVPRGHDLRLLNLRDLTREVHAAGVKLS